MNIQKIRIHGLQIEKDTPCILVIDNIKYNFLYNEDNANMNITINPKLPYHQGQLHFKYQDIVYSSGTFFFKQNSDGLSISPQFETKDLIIYLDKEVEFGDNISIEFHTEKPILHDNGILLPNTLYPMFYSKSNKWTFLLKPYFTNSNYPLSVTFHILKKNKSKISTITHHNILVYETNRISLSDEDNKQFLLSDFSLQNITIRQVSRDISDADVWDSVNWFKNNCSNFDNYPDNIVGTPTKLTPFDPLVCHRKMYTLDGIDEKKYIFSPMIEASNKWTPIHEIINYKLAQFLIVPKAFYIPEIYEAMIENKGIGSLKLFINIRNKDVTTKNIKNSKDFAWLMIYDYLIANIERNWNDHICTDTYGKYCLLDNDLGMYHANESLLPDQNVINNLPTETVKQLKTLNLESFGAPFHWVDFIKPRLALLLEKIQNLEKLKK